MNVVRYRTRKPGMFTSLFDDFFTHPVINEAAESEREYRVRPAANVQENEDEFNIELAVPGFNKKDMKVEVNDGVLTLSGELESTSKEDQANYKRREFVARSFARRFTLPDDISEDKITANYVDGVLLVKLPKNKEAKLERARQIKVG